MSSSISRRHFGMTTLATGAGSIFAGLGLHATISSLLVSPEKQILAKLTELFPRVLIQGFTHQGERQVRAAVSIDDLTSFLDPAKRESALPAVAIRAEGDTLRFSDEGTRFEIRLLLPQDFARQSGEAFQV